DDAANGPDLFSSPIGAAGPIGRLLSRMLSPARQRESSGAPGADGPVRMTQSHSRATAGSSLTMHTADALDAFTAFDRPSPTYPEWDVHRRRYRPEWCTVVESDAPRGHGSAALADALGLRRSLARLGLELTPCRRQAQGDDIDIDAAVEALVDRVAGTPHEDDF